MGIDMNTALDSFVVLAAAGVLAVLSVLAAAIAVASRSADADASGQLRTSRNASAR
jgi:hypothetical protein